MEEVPGRPSTRFRSQNAIARQDAQPLQPPTRQEEDSKARTPPKEDPKVGGRAPNCTIAASQLDGLGVGDRAEEAEEGRGAGQDRGRGRGSSGRQSPAAVLTLVC